MLIGRLAEGTTHQSWPIVTTQPLTLADRTTETDKTAGELARALLSFKRPTGFYQTAIVAIIRSFYLGVELRQMLLLLEV